MRKRWIVAALAAFFLGGCVLVPLDWGHHHGGHRDRGKHHGHHGGHHKGHGDYRR